jgi:hypothetical protein
MRPDVARGLFSEGTLLDAGTERHAAARALEDAGLVTLEPWTFVRCVSPWDADIVDAIDRSCAGRVYVRDASEARDVDACCPRCDRPLDVARKRRFDAVRVRPRIDRASAFVRERVATIAPRVREHPAGVLRIETPTGEVVVCLTDVARDAAPAPTEDDPVLFVVADDARLAPGTWGMSPVFRVAELALGGGAAFDDAVHAMIASGRALRRPIGAKRDEPPRAPPALVPLPPGAGWRDVTVYYVDGVTVGVTAPGMRARHLTAIDLGMAKANSRGPSQRFKLLLHLCALGGRTNWRSAGMADQERLTFRSFEAFRMQANPLRRSLREIFGLESDPFASFGERRDLETAFRALPHAPGDVTYVKLDVM